MVDWGKFTLSQILSKNYPPEFWTWASWNDRGRKAPRPPQVARWIKQNGPIPRSWYLRYYVHKGLKPPTFHPKPIPAPEPTPIQHYGMARNFMFACICAENPLAAISISSDYTFWLSADPAYEPTHAEVETIRSKHQIGAWCNPTQISKERLDEFCKKFNIPDHMRLGQSENADEFDASLQFGLKATVGVISSLRSSQKWLIQTSKIFHLEEDYWNVQPWLVPNYENLPVVATIKGIYNGKSDSPVYGRYLSPQDYINAGRWHPGDGFYHAAGPASVGQPDDIKQVP